MYRPFMVLKGVHRKRIQRSMVTRKIGHKHRHSQGTLTDYERKEEAPDRQEPTRVTHVVEGHWGLHEPLAPPYRGPELVAHGQDRQPFARGPVFASVRH